MDIVTQTRGRNVAAFGAVVQTALATAMLILWLWTGSQSALACTVTQAGALLLWLFAALLFYARKLERAEALELQQLSPDESGIFSQDRQAQSHPASARLAWIDRWLVPGFTLLWAAYQGAIGLLMLRHFRDTAPGAIPNASPALMFAVLLAFVGFLVSRYATGMGTRPEYRPLRAAGSYLLLNVLITTACAAALGLAARGGADSTGFDHYAAMAVPIVQLVLALELAMNFVLDLYRPRLADQEQRLPFDSRVLGLIAEPARVSHSIAETLNYQFGFEVSRTWFYQLVSRSFVPLLVLGGAVLLALTSVVIVEDGQQAVVFRWGRLGRQTLGPGVHFKLPWPAETVQRFNVGQVHQVLLGSGGYRTEDERRKMLVNGKEMQLWSAEHGRIRERDFLVGAPPRTAGVQGVKPPDVDIIKLVASVQYVVDDVRKFGFTYANPHEMIESIASNMMTEYCATATLDRAIEGADPDRPQAIMTFGRGAAADQLRKRIQLAVDKANLGVRIVSVGFLAVHPPAKAADAYEKMHEQERGQAAQRYRAQGDANRVLSEVAGDPAAALQLAFAIRAWQNLDALRLATGDQRQQQVRRQLGALAVEMTQLREELSQERLAGRSESEDASGTGALLARCETHQTVLENLLNGKASLADEISLARQAVEGPDGLYARATGTAASELAAASAQRWQQEMAAREVVTAARAEQTAYRASPRLYVLDRWLDVWDQALPGAVKYVIGMDVGKLHTWLNLERQPTVMPGLNMGQSNK